MRKNMILVFSFEEIFASFEYNSFLFVSFPLIFSVLIFDYRFYYDLFILQHTEKRNF